MKCFLGKSVRIVLVAALLAVYACVPVGRASGVFNGYWNNWSSGNYRVAYGDTLFDSVSASNKGDISEIEEGDEENQLSTASWIEGAAGVVTELIADFLVLIGVWDEDYAQQQFDDLMYLLYGSTDYSAMLTTISSSLLYMSDVYYEVYHYYYYYNYIYNGSGSVTTQTDIQEDDDESPWSILNYYLASSNYNTSYAAKYLYTISSNVSTYISYLAYLDDIEALLEDGFDVEFDVSEVVDALTYSSSRTTTVAYYLRNLWYYFVSMSYSTGTYGSIYYLTSATTNSVYTYSGTSFYERVMYAMSAISRNTAYTVTHINNLQDEFDFSDSDWSDYYTDLAGWADYVYSTLNSSNTYLSNLSDGLYYNSNSVAYWAYMAYYKLNAIDTDNGDIADRLTYNSGNAAYWLYLIYDALADASSSLTALDRLTSIYTELSNLNETVEGLDLDITVDVSSSFADTLASALPDALALTTLTVDFSGLVDSLLGIDFNIGNLADINLDVSGVVDALEDYLDYSGYSAAQLLYLCWGELAGLDLDVPEVDLSGVLDALGDIYDALTYVTDDDSLLSTASADGVAAVASTSTTVTNAQLLYRLLAKMSSYTDYLSGIDSGLTKILYRLAAEDDDDFLEALQTFAESLLTSSTLATVAASAADSLASSLLPLVVLNLTIDLFLTIVSIEPVEPEFEIVIPIMDGLNFTDTYSLGYVDDYLPVIQAAILILYAIGLAASFKSWVSNLGGGE